MKNFLNSQIITYMGNKRKLLVKIDEVIDKVKRELQQDSLISGDGFSGSGIVARLLKTKSTQLHVNDIAGYSQTLNRCYLSTPTKEDHEQILSYIEEANKFAHCGVDKKVPSWIQVHWAPSGEITSKDRVYFTQQNGILIDRYRAFIASIDSKFRPYLLAPLLVQASIHNNTNGQFSAFYKKDGRGCFGGKTGTDIKRITQPIYLEKPIFSPSPCQVTVSRTDTNEWIKKIPPVDLMYYDPPYNKHPYSIYYFMLDIINDWNLEIQIPSTYRGQPKNWHQSAYNSYVRAKSAMKDLIHNTRAKFILLSYNNRGIIPLDELGDILGSYGKVERIPICHKTYNKLKGIASYKRTGEWKEVNEFLWLVDTRKN